jgi:hypothetical protein
MIIPIDEANPLQHYIPTLRLRTLETDYLPRGYYNSTLQLASVRKLRDRYGDEYPSLRVASEIRTGAHKGRGIQLDFPLRRLRARTKLRAMLNDLHPLAMSYVIDAFDEFVRGVSLTEPLIDALNRGLAEISGLSLEVHVDIPTYYFEPSENSAIVADCEEAD